MKKIRYIEEIYTNEYRSLFQAIQIDTHLEKESNGRYSKELRATINPNLALVRRRYLTDTYEVVKEEIIGASDGIKWM